MSAGSSLFKIAGGTVYDPANGIDGQVRDLWIDGQRIVAAPADPQVRPARTLDARGMVLMPGGVDMHCHIAGPTVNFARRMRCEEKRLAEPVRRTRHTHSGTLGSVPSTFATGYKYAALGYTTAFDAAIAPLAARAAHEELADTPCIDKGFYILLGNNEYLMREIGRGEQDRVTAFLGWVLGASKAYAPKLVNPGGVEVWKQTSGGNVAGLDTMVEHFGVTPRQILLSIAKGAADLRLPHQVHVHANNLGMPGNWTTTLETMCALEGHGGHLTHIQFHSYGGGGPDDQEHFCSKVAELADYVNNHANITVDVGQVMFGPTTSMTGDGPLGYYLSNMYGTRWFSCDIELEAGCGIAPIEYKQKSLVNALQWAIGLEWYLLVKDPWRVVMSTDHPNGGSFLAYPQIIRLLMDRTWRNDVLKTVHPLVRERSTLADLDREYTLNDICIITRAGPARLLGLKHKGHLGPGADADITIYTPHANAEVMFELPRYVIKAGQVIVEHGEIRAPVMGKTIHVQPAYDDGVKTNIADWFERYSSVRMGNYPVTPEQLGEHEIITCGGND